MDEVTQKLRRALGIDASDRRLALLTDNGSTARGTDLGQGESLRALVVRNYLDDLWNYIARLADNNSVADPDILSLMKS